eukprot:TRINITY_DN13212_c0_g1_i1.p1 TRINITY_DN13212_c0_g1~~TRINITY_DN13212_c0_g1_i1.p1  ORF type:complete len:379 (+),score=87.02 TRINITY_DN13212_c0_g1_i1:250-1386(+)
MSAEPIEMHQDTAAVVVEAKADAAREIEPSGQPAEEEEEGSFTWHVLFWVLMSFAGLVLGVIYLVVKSSDDDCNHGTALPGDVTAPDDIDFADVVSIIYGYVPYVCGLACLVILFWRRTMWPLLLLLVGSVIVVLNEGLFKRVIAQDRPSGSCIHSKGMPSSHATLAITYWVLFNLEVLLKPHVTSTSSWTLHSKAAVLVAAWVLLLPVPFTRVVLKDHSWAQIGVGALIGTCVAVGWYLVLSYWAYKRLDKISDYLGKCKCCWGQGLFHHFTNDYYPPPPPDFRSSNQQDLRACRRVAHSLEDTDGATQQQDPELADSTQVVVQTSYDEPAHPSDPLSFSDKKVQTATARDPTAEATSPKSLLNQTSEPASGKWPVG